MEYTHDRFRVQEFTNAPSGECGLQMIGNAEVCQDLDAMVAWYQDVMGMRVFKEFGSGDDRVVYMADEAYDPVERNAIFVLQQARQDFEKSHQQEHGPYISSIIYQAQDLQRAWDDALWAGMEALQKPAVDEATGATTAYLREPCGGNIIMLREQMAA
jgi:4-hydroxyphenylpyruvate dioxygenase-like putative hemolysin